MKKITLSMILSGLALISSAATFNIPITPNGDGVIVDKDGDGIADQATATGDNNGVREISSGKIWGGNYKAHFEFKMPPGELKIKSAKLVLSLNGNFGCHPEKPGSAGPETALFYYLTPDANGTVELTDDGAGQKIGIFMPGSPVKDPRQPISCDVTAAVREAVTVKSAYLGFRLEASENSDKNSSWRWRTAEFAEKYGKNFYPQLIIETE